MTLKQSIQQEAAFITEIGGAISHATILCRPLGIPKVTGIAAATRAIWDGQRILVDAEHATVVVAPNRGEANNFARMRLHYGHCRLQVQEEEERCCVEMMVPKFSCTPISGGHLKLILLKNITLPAWAFSRRNFCFAIRPSSQPCST
jgi:hypothetical protein